MTQAAALVRSFSVGLRTVTLSMQRPEVGKAVTMIVEWTPDAPCRLSSAEMRQYRTGRDAAIAELAERLGINAAVVEM